MQLNPLSLAMFILTIFAISMADFITLIRARFKEHHRTSEDTPENEDFSLLIPIFGDMKYLKNVDFLKQYAKHVILCTTTKETPEFNHALEVTARKYGFKVFRSDVPLATKTHKPNPWKLFSNTLSTQNLRYEINKEIARDEIIRDSFASVTTKYCIFIDGDTITKDSLLKLVGLMEEKDYDIASVRVLASKEDTIMEKLQSVEYKLAMDARKIYPWLTSGAGVVAKTEVIRHIMQHHSLFFSGGDIEIGKLAGLLKYHVGHLRFEFYTDVPSTFKAWFKQRMAWFGGGFRHAIVNMHRYTWRHPMFYLYTTVLVYGLTPLRWYEVIAHPEVLPVVIVLYLALIYIFHWKERQWFFLLFPFYALMQILVILPLGVYTYFRMALSSKNIGHIKLRHTKKGTLRNRQCR